MAKMEFGELDQYLFGQATHYDIYKKLGAHPVTQNGKSGTYFAVWAPGARRVSVVGDFNYWNGMLYPMHKMENSDIFELFIPGLSCGQFYKFEIKNVQGDIIQMVDPYAVMNEEKENGASRMFDLGRFRWEDSRWLSKRYHGNVFKIPMSVCEVRISELDSPDEKVQEIVQDMGHTHILLRGTPERAKLGVERGFFEPAFYGNTPDTMRFFVNRSHKRNIGVMLEISPEYLTRAVHLFEKKHPQAVNYLLANILFWIKEYHIDGFRFDLMGVLDIDTMNVIAERLKEIRPDIYLYGEGWNGGPSSLAEEKRAFKASAKKMPGIGMFNDDIRDTIKGSVFYDDHLGFVNGGTHLENALRYGITGAVAHPQVDYDAYGSKPWAKEPGQSINYVSCHDNYTLWDKLSVSCPEASEEKKKAMNRLCAAIVFTSQGVPFIQAGEEFLRSKPLPEKKGFAENSYNMPDAVNSIKWDNIHEYPDMIAYYKGLMALRKAHPVFRMQSEAEMTQNLCFLSDTPENVVAYLLKGKGADDTPENILVIFNGNDEEILYNLPEGKWKILVDDKTAGADGKKKISEKIDVEPLSALVLEKE